MSEEFIVSESTINISNPRKKEGLGMVIIGVVLSLIGLIFLYIKKYVDFLNFQTLFEPKFEYFVYAIISLFCLIIGIGFIIVGIKNIYSWIIPAHAPKNYGDLDLVFNTFRTSDICTYKKPDTFSFKILRAIFSDKALYFTPVFREIAQDNINYLLKSIIFSAFVLFFWDGPFIKNFFTIPLIILLFIAAILCIILNFLILPKNVPTAKRIFEAQDIHGGHPQKMYRSLQDGSKEIKYDYPYRFLSNEPTMNNIGVENTGTSQGFTFIESQPLPVQTQNETAAIFAMICAGFFLITGFFWLVSGDSMVYPVGSIIPITGAIVVGIGFSFLGKSSKLFNTLRFKSKAIFTEVKGEYYKSDIGVGTGMHDSLSSKRLAVISDNRLNYYAADVLSECYTLKNEREIVATNNSNEVDSDLQSLMKFVESQRKPDLEVQGIDFDQASAASLIQQNMAIGAIKASQQNQLPQTDFEQKLIMQMKQNDLQDKSKETKGEDKNKIFCSDCGINNTGARFCKNCGREFK